MNRQTPASILSQNEDSKTSIFRMLQDIKHPRKLFLLGSDKINLIVMIVDVDDCLAKQQTV